MRRFKVITSCLSKLEGRKVELVELGDVISIVDQKTLMPTTTRQFTDIHTAKEYAAKRGFLL